MVFGIAPLARHRGRPLGWSDAWPVVDAFEVKLRTDGYVAYWARIETMAVGSLVATAAIGLKHRMEGGGEERGCSGGVGWMGVLRRGGLAELAEMRESRIRSRVKLLT